MLEAGGIGLVLVGGAGGWWRLLGGDGGCWEGLVVGRRDLGLVGANIVLPVT